MLTKPCVNFSCFESLTDPRRPFGNLRHDLIDIVVIALCGTICCCETWDDMEDFAHERHEWLSQYLSLPNGIPGHDTIARVISSLDSTAFLKCLQQWIESLGVNLKGRGIHIDGKTARRSFDSQSNLKALHTVSAWVDELNICLGQVATDEKSNEITAVPALLELLEIKGGVVTLDAMNCQQKTVEQIIEQKADYVITVKGNQPTLHDAIRQRFLDDFEADERDPSVRSHRRETRSRGRLGEQVVTVAPVPAAIRKTGKWKGIKSIGMVYRSREAAYPERPRSIPSSEHITYFISSLKPTASLIAKYLHRHWTVENSLHWTLDVTFTEDHSRVRKGTAPAILGALRRFVISLLKRDTSMPKTSLKRKRFRAALNTDNLEAILAAN